MPSYFFDTSAIAKHYHPEKGTPEVERLLNESGSSYLISRLSAVELQSVFALKVRTRVITLPALQRLQKLFAIWLPAAFRFCGCCQATTAKPSDF